MKKLVEDKVIFIDFYKMINKTKSKPFFISVFFCKKYYIENFNLLLIIQESILLQKIQIF